MEEIIDIPQMEYEMLFLVRDTITMYDEILQSHDWSSKPFYELRRIADRYIHEIMNPGCGEPASDEEDDPYEPPFNPPSSRFDYLVLAFISLAGPKGIKYARLEKDILEQRIRTDTLGDVLENLMDRKIIYSPSPGIYKLF